MSDRPYIDRNALYVLLQQGESVERIAGRFGRHPSTIAYWMRKHELVAPLRAKHAAKGGIDRGELEALVNEGLSIRELAKRLDRSTATVRHWLRFYGLRTLKSRRRDQRRAVVEAVGPGQSPPDSLEMECRVHGVTDFVREGSGYYRCRRCRAANVSHRRRRLKALLVEDAGGCCLACGYAGEPRALQFHHLDPSQKRFTVSRQGVTRSLESLRVEAGKCVLLCSNCHAEVEGGSLRLPDTVRGQESPGRQDDPG